QARHVDDQRHAAVPQNRGAGQTLDLSVIGLQAADHHLLLSEQLVHEQRDFLAVALDDDDETVRRLPRGGLDAEDAVQPDQGQHFASEREGLDVVQQDVEIARPWPDTLDDRQQRDDVDAATDPQALGLQDHEGQGQREVKRRPAPALGPDTDRAAERLDVAGHDIHSDPTAGNLGDAVGRRESRPEDEGEQLAVTEDGRGGDQAAGHRLRADAVAVQAPAIVRDLDVDVAALLIRAGLDATDAILARALTLVRRLDPVIDGVANEVRERIHDVFTDTLVDLGGFAPRVEDGVPAGGVGEIPDQPRQAGERVLGRDHAAVHDPLLELTHAPIHACHRLLERAVHRPDPGHPLRDHGPW